MIEFSSTLYTGLARLGQVPLRHEFYKKTWAINHVTAQIEATVASGTRSKFFKVSV